MPTVLVTPTMLRRVPGPYSEILQAGGFNIVYPPDGLNTVQPGVIGGLLDGVDAMLASVEPLTPEVLAKSRLRAVARMGVGYDSIDIPAATERGIAVTITPGTLEPSVAEHTIAMIMAAARDLRRRDLEVRAGAWSRIATPRLAGKTLGLVGLGRIAKAVATRALGLEMRVVACDVFPDEEFASRWNIQYLTLDELLAVSDVVSLHVTTTPETYNLMNAERIARMKPRAILVNTARGAVVDEAALYAAMKAGHLQAAALDVFKQEPLPTSSPLLELDNVLLCTHMGGLDEESQIATSSLAAQCLVDLLHGRRPQRCLVNPQLPADWRW